MSTDSILRVHFREHNRSVVFASAATLLFAVIGWALVYGVSYWFTVAFLSVKDGLLFNGTEHFNRNFLSCVAVLYVATLVDRWVFRYSPEAVDRRPFSETLLDIALFLPRMTLPVFENFMVWIHLSHRQMALATRCARSLFFPQPDAPNRRPTGWERRTPSVRNTRRGWLIESA